MMVIILEESKENKRCQPIKIQYSVGCRVSDQEENIVVLGKKNSTQNNKNIVVI